jgi:hypothetical protein
MATLKDLEKAIDKLLNHRKNGIFKYELANKSSDTAYEAYIFGLVLKAVRGLKVSPKLKAIKGQPLPFIFRGSPGRLSSKKGKNFGYAEFSLNNMTFEVHIDIQINGLSGMLHEVDVCIIHKRNADICRAKDSDPNHRALVVGIECKFYTKDLDKSLGREFLGLVTDMGSPVRLTLMCSNQSSDKIKQFFTPKKRPTPVFDLSPLTKTTEDDFLSEIRATLKRMTGV